jgi:hypothetical protein
LARALRTRTEPEADELASLRLLDTDATPLGPPPMSDAQALEALRLMKLSRALDTLATKLQRLGRVGVYSPVHGQEASVVGSALALDPARDWLVPRVSRAARDVRPMMFLSSLDHRVLDGLGGARFLSVCREWLEDVTVATPI